MTARWVSKCDAETIRKPFAFSQININLKVKYCAKASFFLLLKTLFDLLFTQPAHAQSNTRFLSTIPGMTALVPRRGSRPRVPMTMSSNVWPVSMRTTTPSCGLGEPNDYLEFRPFDILTIFLHQQDEVCKLRQYGQTDGWTLGWMGGHIDSQTAEHV